MKMMTAVFLLLFFGLAKAYAAELSFAQVSDVHYSVKQSDERGRCVDCSRDNLIKIINSINQRDDIDFVVFSGDMIDKSCEKNLSSFMEEISRLNKPYYVLPGNHDTHEIAGLSKDRFWNIVSNYSPYQGNIEPNQKIKLCNGFEMFLVDGAARRFPSSHGYFSEETLAWLNKTLKKSQSNNVLIFQHFPILPPLDNPSHEVLNPDDYKNVISKYNHIVMIASGHFHGGNGVIRDNGVYHVSTPSALGRDVPYRIFKIDYKRRILAPAKINTFNTYVQSL